MTELLLEGDRVVVVGGIWPLRKGCKGTVLRAGRATTRVMLDDDPLAVGPNAEDVIFDTDDLKIWRIAEHVVPPTGYSRNTFH